MGNTALLLERQGVQHDAREVTTPIRLLLALVAIKVVGLAVDPTIRVYLGDSAAYLFGAMDDGRLPDDRSFTYSLLIRGLVRPFDSLWALVYWQTLAGIGAALLTFHMLVARLGVTRRLALAAACLVAIGPAQLYYERMVLAETFGLLGFMLFVAALAAYVWTGRARWLPLVVLLGLAGATLRLNYVPVVIVLSAIAPLVRRFAQAPPRWAEVVRHSVIAVVCVVLMHGAFQVWVSFIFNSPPGYIARAGFMQLGLVMPLVKPYHLEAAGLPPDFASSLRYPIEDPSARMRHMWSQGGFVRTLRERNMPVEPVARPLVRMAVLDDPLGVVRLGIHTVGDYFREEGIAHALENDLGRRVIPEEILWTLRERWNYDATGVWEKTTAVSWYYERGTWWLVACLFLLVPLSVATVWILRRTPYRAQAALLALVGTGLVLAHVLFVPVAFYRYLHPLPPFVIIAVAVLCDVATRRARWQESGVS